MAGKSLLIVLLLGVLLTNGCGALIGASFKELSDHGDDAVYENKSFGEHFVDELFEDDDHHHCHCTHTYRCHRHR